VLHDPLVPQPWGEPSPETAGPSPTGILTPPSDRDIATGARILIDALIGSGPRPPARRAENRP